MNSFDKNAARETAIANLGGSEVLYNKYLDKFKKNYAGVADEIVTAMEASDIEEARRLAHSVKGLAAMLGLIPASEAASRLEILFKEAIERKTESGSASECAFMPELLAQIMPALEDFRKEIIEACK